MGDCKHLRKEKNIDGSFFCLVLKKKCLYQRYCCESGCFSVSNCNRCPMFKEEKQEQGK